MNNLTQRLLTGIVFIAVMVAAMLWSETSTLLLFLIINNLCLFEYLNVSKTQNNQYIRAISAFIFGTWVYLFVGFSWILNEPEVKTTLWILSFTAPYVLLLLFDLFSSQKNLFKQVKHVAFGSLFFGIPFGIVAYYIQDSYYEGLGNEHTFYILPLLLFVWTNDTFAYIGGKLLGKHKLMSRVSPNKTVEGFISGLLFTSIVSYLLANQGFSPIKADAPLFYHLITGISVGTAATIGDLIQSAFKRFYGVKDTGKILPGHGGAWDRFDGLIAAIPAYHVLLLFLS